MRVLDIKYKNNHKMKFDSLHTNTNIIRPDFGFRSKQVHKYRQVG